MGGSFVHVGEGRDFARKRYLGQAFGVQVDELLHEGARVHRLVVLLCERVEFEVGRAVHQEVCIGDGEQNCTAVVVCKGKGLEMGQHRGLPDTGVSVDNVSAFCARSVPVDDLKEPGVFHSTKQRQRLGVQLVVLVWLERARDVELLDRLGGVLDKGVLDGVFVLRHDGRQLLDEVFIGLEGQLLVVFREHRSLERLVVTGALLVLGLIVGGLLVEGFSGGRSRQNGGVRGEGTALANASEGEHC